ncbi:LysR family transcriptional regulator [Providencia burhodogranariea]|uniref:LysR family transcriptional regulator n=1 Tax=Providencia burhodogranariea DSM 19968 TaxID=1141662 RepID=K8WJT1_9GAMM|nr:LysR family transcriptional regulator [Providencia burhodogranariea]EKT60804.1 LysR family transcriptional regulator [Providencia burhodogranariea DSM 19968]
MDCRQLNAFIAVFEERNITAAARRLFLTQPALSSTIKMLEESLGTALFKRLPRGVEVTEDARILYPHAQRMVAEMEALTHSFKRERHRQSLQVGIEHDIANSQISHFLQQIHDPEFNLLISLESGCKGDLRLGCEELRCEDELFLPLNIEPFVLAIPADHSLAQRETITAADLHSVCWVMCPELSWHQRFLPIYGASAHSPAANTGSFSLALNLVSQGLGVAIVPESLALEHTQIVIRSLLDHGLSRRIGICYAVQSLSSPAVEQLLQHLIE